MTRKVEPFLPRTGWNACDSGSRYLTTALFNGAGDTPTGYRPYSREKLESVQQ